MADAWGTPGWTATNGIPLTSDLPPATIPLDVKTVKIVGQLGAIDGKHQTGFMLFEASSDLTHVPSGGVSHKPSWLSRIIEGKLEITIPATDNTVLSPSGWNYKVTMLISGQVVRSFHTLVPTSIPDVQYTSLIAIP